MNPTTVALACFKYVGLVLGTFLDWLCYSPLLLIAAVLTLALVDGWVASGYGILYLFWHAHFGTQLSAGVAVALLLGEICLVGYLLTVDRAVRRQQAAAAAMPPAVVVAPAQAPAVGEAEGAVAPDQVPAAAVPDAGAAPLPLNLRAYLLATWAPLMGLILIAAVVRLETYQAPARPPGFLGDVWTLEPGRGQEGGGEARPATHVALVWGLWDRYAFVLGTLLTVVVAWLVTRYHRYVLPQAVLWIPWVRRQVPRGLRDRARRERLPPRALWDILPNSARLTILANTFFILLALVYLFLFVGSLFSGPYGHLSPALGICVLFSLLVSVYGFILHSATRWLYPVTAVLILLALLCSLTEHKHRLPGLEEYYKTPHPTADLADYETARRTKNLLDDQAALRAWYRRLQPTRPEQSRPPLVIVTTSGGGIAASMWTVAVLTALEEDIPGFSSHVRLISGASGGMVGAAHYVAELDRLHELDDAFRANELDAKAYQARRCALLRQVRERMAAASQDSLTQVGRYAILRDVPALYYPFAYSEDRGLALEYAWAAALDNRLEIDFHCLRPGEEAGWRPSLVFAPMLVEDGRRLLISNLDLDWMVKTTARSLDGKNAPRSRLSVSVVEFYKLFPDVRFKLGTAARLNASFPYVSPVTTIPTNPSRRVVDAGYYDNYGQAVAGAWLARHANFMVQQRTPVLLIQIRAYANQADRSRWVLRTDPNVAGAGLPYLARGAEGLTTPAQGLFNARNATQMYRGDDFMDVLDRYLNAIQATTDSPLWGSPLKAVQARVSAGPGQFREVLTPTEPLFATAIFECPSEISLSWYLTPAEIRAIEDGIPGIKEAASGNPIRRQNQDVLKALAPAFHPPVEGGCGNAGS
jgi:hypothetical protein